MSKDNTNEVLSFTGKSTDETIPATLELVNEEVNTGFMSFLFVLLSNINGIKYLLEASSKYFFPFAFALKAADWLFYLWKFSQSTNPNLSRFSNLVIKTITTGLVGFAVFGAAAISVTLSPIIFSIAIGIDLLFSFGKFIYFGVKALTTEEGEENDLYKSKAKEHGIKSAVTALILGAVIVSMIVAPYVAPIIIAVIAVTAAVALVTLGVIAVVNYFRQGSAREKLRAEADHSPEIVEVKESVLDLDKENENQITQDVENNNEDDTPKLSEPDNTIVPKKSFELSPQKYPTLFANKINLLTPITGFAANEIDELKQLITGHITKIEGQINNGSRFIEDYVWSENSKRTDKINALKFLNKLIDQFDNVKKGNSITIDGIVFNYKNTNDFILEINKHITHNYKSAYRSFFKEIGDVQALFSQAYKLLLAKNKYEAKNDAQAVVTKMQSKSSILI